MALIQKLKDKWKQNREKRRGIGRLALDQATSDLGTAPPVIETQWGNVSESARYQAALNMRDDPMKRREVEALLMQKLGMERGLAESRRRYPEAYQDQE